MLNAADGMAGKAAGDVLGRRVRGGVTMAASWPLNMREPATGIKRLLAKRAERRREQEAFKAWLQITADSLW
jgi:hypothetical protein